MAQSLAWGDLTEEQLGEIGDAGSIAGKKSLIASIFGLEQEVIDEDHPEDYRKSILLDFYFGVLQHLKEADLSAEKASTFFSIIKATRSMSVEERLTLERSFAYFKGLMMRHSVQRPPYSVGIFTLPEVQKLTEWALEFYYKQYKLHQYTFTERITLSVTTSNPGDDVEKVPELQPLNDALTEEEWTAKLDEEARVKAEEEEKARLEKEANDEEARQKRIEDEYSALIPDEVTSRVEAVLEVELAKLREAMEDQFTKQEETLVARIGELEGKVGA